MSQTRYTQTPVAFIAPNVETFAATMTLDPSVGCSAIAATSGFTLNISNGIADGQPFQVIISNNAVGSPYALTWGASVIPGGTINLPIGQTITIKLLYYSSQWLEQ